MKDATDFAVATGGISAPVWLPAMNEWVALVMGILSIIYLIVRVFQIWKERQ